MMTGSRRRYALYALGAAGGVMLAIATVALVEHFGSTFTSARYSNGGAGPTTVSAPSVEAGGTMSLHDTPRTLPELRFEDGNGRPVTLADFRDKLVLLNIWATWCLPCRREMPTLDRLQAKLGGPDFEVVALSIDRTGIEVVDKFYAEVGVGHLAKYIDASGKAAPQLGAVGLPTTLLIDSDGQEIARRVGPAEWDTPEMIEFFRQRLSRDSGALRPGTLPKSARGPAADRSAVTASTRNLRTTRLELPFTVDPAVMTIEGPSS